SLSIGVGCCDGYGECSLDAVSSRETCSGAGCWSAACGCPGKRVRCSSARGCSSECDCSSNCTCCWSTLSHGEWEWADNDGCGSGCSLRISICDCDRYRECALRIVGCREACTSSRGWSSTRRGPREGVGCRTARTSRRECYGCSNSTRGWTALCYG